MTLTDSQLELIEHDPGAAMLPWYGDELNEAAFRQRMLDEPRLICEFEIEKAYGMD